MMTQPLVCLHCGGYRKGKSKVKTVPLGRQPRDLLPPGWPFSYEHTEVSLPCRLFMSTCICCFLLGLTECICCITTMTSVWRMLVEGWVTSKLCTRLAADMCACLCMCAPIATHRSMCAQAPQVQPHLQTRIGRHPTCSWQSGLLRFHGRVQGFHAAKTQGVEMPWQWMRVAWGLHACDMWHAHWCTAD